MRVFYFAPDFVLPSGGVRVIYEHVAILREHGFEAFVVHTRPKWKSQWHQIEVPVVYSEDNLEFESTDWLVILEPFVRQVSRATKGFKRKIVLALSWSYIHPKLEMGEDWHTYGIKRVITPSSRIADYVEWSMGIPAKLIGRYVDPARYYFDPKEKKLRVSYMSRKNDSGTMIQRIASTNKRRFRNVTWEPFLDTAIDEYAAKLRSSRIYLSVGSREGENISALEAMACGCLVISYLAGGGRDYMIGHGRKQNCILVDGDDFFEMGRELEKVIQTLQRKPKAYDAIVANAIRTAAPHKDRKTYADSITKYFKNLSK